MNRAAARPRTTRSTPPRAAAPQPPPPLSATAASSPSPPPPSSASAPPFGRLLLTAFHSVGIDYIALDHLRKAKKNALNPREYTELWRLLHDLVLIVLLDFDIDTDAIRAAFSSSSGHEDLLLWQELARVSLYDWGFVCSAFYSAETPDASILLLALAWLLAYSRLFERQHEAILHLYLTQKPASTLASGVRLPPYPNDVSLSETVVHEAVDGVVADHEAIFARLMSVDASSSPASITGITMSDQLHQLQAIVGRIFTHVRALQSAVQSYAKMLARLEEEQRQSGAVDDEELLPAYMLQVIAQGKSRLELHMRVISERLQMLEDEKLFYKWINSLLLLYAPPPLSPVTTSATPTAALSGDTGISTDDDNDALRQREACSLRKLTVAYADLDREMRLTRSKVDESSALCRQIGGLYAQEKQKWRQKPKTRTQQVKMDEKMDKLRHEIATNELWDVPTLLLDSISGGGGGGGAISTVSQQDPKSARQSVKTEAEPPVREAELVQLQQQLERVMKEITTEYCRVELQ